MIFHFCPPMVTIKTMVFHLSTSWVLLGPWFSVFPENSLAGSTVQKHVWYYWDHGFSFKHPMGTIRTMVFCLSHMWVLLRRWFSKKPSNCCYSTHGFNSAGKSITQQKCIRWRCVTWLKSAVNEILSTKCEVALKITHCPLTKLHLPVHTNQDEVTKVCWF